MWPVDCSVVLDGQDDLVVAWQLYTGPGHMPASARFQAAWTISARDLLRIPVWGMQPAILSTDRAKHLLPRPLVAPTRLLHGPALMQLLTLRTWALSELREHAVDGAGAGEQAPGRWPNLAQLGLPTESPAYSESPRNTASHNAIWLARFCIAWSATEHDLREHPHHREAVVA